MKQEWKFAVLGSPIVHSRTPALQTFFAGQAGFHASCDRIEIVEAELPARLEQLADEEYDGFNCTMPLKTAMTSYCQSLSDDAALLSSVNTVSIVNRTFAGTTTDGAGVVSMLKDECGDSFLKNAKVTLLGAGGAARSVALALSSAGARLTVLNRTKEKAESLSAMLVSAGLSAPNVLPLDQAGLSEAADCDLFFQATSLGMTGKDRFDSFAFLDLLPADAVVADAVYEPLETDFLKEAKARGHLTFDGLSMLVYQGALSFETWTGKRPAAALCRAAYRFLQGKNKGNEGTML